MKCYHWFDISFHGSEGSGSGSTQQQNQAYVALTSGTVNEDQNWYVDSGATNHVTADLQNLSIKSDCKGKGKLIVGNGSELKISHIGDIFLSSQHSQKSLFLHNILHVPNITKNLISISQFTKDNDVVIEFFFDCCLIKDKVTRKILIQGALKHGLYQLDPEKVYSQSSIGQSLVSCFAQVCTSIDKDSISNSLSTCNIASCTDAKQESNS